jgi:GABA(A) receptor-associated protein
MFSSNFKKKNSFQERVYESQQIMLKHPDKRPIICEKLQSQKDLPELDKKKYLIPCSFTLGQFVYTIRERMKLHAEDAIFLFVNGQIITSSAIIGSVYKNFRDADGFLYVQYAKESAFG